MEKIENQLYTATVRGDTESLNDLLKKDKFILDQYESLSGFCCNKTPLHIAATRGYVQFAKVLLRHKPSLVSQLDLQLRSPLHMACANGQVEMVDMLLDANTDLCLMEDQFGRTPLHIAAMAMGSVQVVNKLVMAKAEAIMYPLNRTKTIGVLHLYVIRNGPEALKQLVRVDHTFLNSQDGEGNTILHKVVSLKKLELLEYLVSCTEIVVNLKNQNSLTAWDMIKKIPRDAEITKMQQLLLGIGAGITANFVKKKINPDINNHTPTSLESTKENKKKNALHTWLEERTNALLVSATLIASMAFQAGLNPPGGIWGEDNPDYEMSGTKVPVKAGTSIMAVHSTKSYIDFLWYNTISFIAALSLVLLLISGPPRFRWFGARLKMAYMWLLTAVIWLTASMTILTYRSVIYGVSPGQTDNDYEGMDPFYHALATAKWVLYSWTIFIGVLFLVKLWPLLHYVIKKVQRCKGEQQNLCNPIFNVSIIV